MSLVDIHALWLNRSFSKARSWTEQRGSSNGGAVVAITAELNRKDASGRTVLHLIASETDPSALPWLHLILSFVGSVQVNAQDRESGWTALHRALWCGNIAGARLLLERNDVDATIKDREGNASSLCNVNGIRLEH